ncbi:MAG: hypothetical protein J7M08_10075 [Planctomycetes bacterium]|nr:hypothetical protein [Planctomycetota bacterium]
MNETAPNTAQAGLLSWEDLGRQPAGRAFRRSLALLLRRPPDFFGRMAQSGGLHEPVTFFLIVLGALIVLAFPAALALLGLIAPDPAKTPADLYQLQILPSRVCGLLLVLLPLALVAAATVMVLLGTLFQVGGRPFGAGGWEASVSVWLYSGAAALCPVVAAAGLALVVSLVGFLLSLPWPGLRPVAAEVANWATWIASPIAGLVALVLLTRSLACGCAGAFHLEGTQGAAAAVSGLLLVAATVGGCWIIFARRGLAMGLAALALCLIIIGPIAAVRRKSLRGSFDNSELEIHNSHD